MFKLQNMRHHKHLKWPVYFFFGIVIVSFIFFYGWGKNADDAGSGIDQNFARLRSESVNPLKRWHNLDGRAVKGARYETEMDKYRIMPPLPPQIRQMLEQNRVMERLVTTEDSARTAADDILLERAARQMNVSVSTQEIIDILRKQPQISDEMLDAQARMMNLADKFAYVEFIRRQQEEGRVKELKSLAVHASLFELWQEYSLSKEKLVLRMAAYPAEQFESKVTVTQKDLEDYLAAHKSEFYVPAKRRYAYVRVSKQELVDAIKPTQEQLQVYYQQNQAQYKRNSAARVATITSPLSEDQASTPALAALNAARAEAAKQDDWSTLTQNLTKSGKGLEFFSNTSWIDDNAAERSPMFMARLKALDVNKGTTTAVDNDGVHLLRVLERRKEGVPPLSEIRAQVESDYKTKEADKQFAAQVERFKDERKKLDSEKATTGSLRLIAQRLKLKDALTTSVTASDTYIPGVGSFDKDATYLAGLATGELSEAIQTPEEVAVLQVVEAKEGYDPKLAEVKDKIDQAVRRARSIDLAKTAAEQSQKLVESGAEFNQALADAPKPPFSSGEFTRLESVMDLGAPLIGFKQQTLKVNVGSTGLSPYGQDSDKPQGYTVWKVEKLIPPKQEEFDKERQRFEQEYIQVQRETMVREWLADERAKAKYEYLAGAEQE